MNKNTLIAAAVLGLLVQPMAHASFSIAGSVGGAPTGVNQVNFDNLTLGSPGGTASGPNGSIVVSVTGNGGIVQGNSATFYAEPDLSGGNGTGFGSPNQADGLDTTTYLQTGTVAGGGKVTLTFGGPQMYFGMLWGSVDSFNSLDFYSGGVLGTHVGTVTGADVASSPNGDQGVNGTLYVNITSTTSFDTVVATSTGYTFEFDNVAYNTTIPVTCSGCVLSQGYYKNHSKWPVNTLKLGTVSYTEAQLQSILGTPVKGNGLLILAYQLIAAKLNIASGACAPTSVTNAIAAADILIGGLVIPPVGTAKADPSLTSGLGDILDDYNNGLTKGGPSACKD